MEVSLQFFQNFLKKIKKYTPLVISFKNVLNLSENFTSFREISTNFPETIWNFQNYFTNAFLKNPILLVF